MGESFLLSLLLPSIGVNPLDAPPPPSRVMGPADQGPSPWPSPPAGDSGRQEARAGLRPLCHDSWGQSLLGYWSTWPVSYDSVHEAP